jgi:hypothetical protein
MYYARDAFLQCERYRVELWHHLAAEYSDIRFNCMTPGFVCTHGLQKKFPLFYSKYADKTFTTRDFRNDKMAAMFILWCLATPKIGSMPNGALIFAKSVQKEYIIEEHETLLEDHRVLISNLYQILESSV